MGRNWAISVGINNYDNLLPLKYAQKDAEAMATWFKDEAKFNEVFLFTNDSKPIDKVNKQQVNPPIPTQPTFARFQRFLDVQFERPLLKPEDNLWFFFAGHGRRNADQDYLMFLDSNPQSVEKTAISVEYITQRLRRCGADNVVLFIDACRDENNRSGVGIGQQEHKGVITFYSCRANQKSWEINELQHGSFTYTLLEGLQLQGEANCATVERLHRYLSSQIPRLNARYNKPFQNPYLKAEPPYKMYFILLEQSATLKDAEPLKYQASIAENRGDFALAKQLWKRVLALPGVDEDALEAIERIAQKQRDVSDTQSTSQSLTPSTGRRGETSENVIQREDQHQHNLEHYRQSFLQAVEQEFPLSEPSRQKLRNLQQSLQLNDNEVSNIEQSIFEYQEAERLGQQKSITISPPTPINRKQFLKWVGLGGAGLVTTVVGSKIFKEQNPVSTKASILNLEPFEFQVKTVNTEGVVIEQKKSQAQFFKEDLGNNVTLEMVSIPGGKFLMGTEDEEIERLVQKFNRDKFRREKPQHEVTVQPFFMGKYPITQAQWRAIASLPKINFDLDPDRPYFKGEDRPVETVYWRDVVEFCQRLSKQTEKEYRLPSEAEWEYACRAGTKTPFHFGETITGELANCYANNTYVNEPQGEYQEQSTPVGSFSPNPFGLYDMHGNVWEWCEDDWHDNYQDAPTDGSAWRSEKSRKKVVRGGSWNNYPRYCRSAYRNDGWPDNLFINIGFRVVCVLGRTT